MNSKKDQFTTGSALPVKSVCRATYTELIHTKRKLGEPGEFPFTRGIYPEIYRTRLWTMREYTGFDSAEATNLRFKFLIKQGQTGLSVAFDLPTQLALDSDNPRAEGEVGRVGVPIGSVEDMEALFDGISLAEVSTSNRIEHDVFKELARVRKLGGSVRAIENGYIQARIRDSAFRQQLDIESGKKKNVGINILVESEPRRIRIHKIDPALVRRQISRLKALRRRRDENKVERQLAKLKAALDGDQNLMPLIVEAVKAKATTAEIGNVLREVYGEFHPKTRI